MLQDDIRDIFRRRPEVIYSAADVPPGPYHGLYASSLVFAVPYTVQLSEKNYTEEGFEHGIRGARDIIDLIVEELRGVLEKSGVKYLVPPVAQSDEKELLAPFSFKSAAARAGIGWFGKNDVIITERYGPRVRLSAVLIDAPLDYGTPYTEGRCPEDCNKCRDICPCGALKGRQWTLHAERSDMIDYQKCNRMRSAFIKKLGRKNACGLCLAVCPIGQ